MLKVLLTLMGACFFIFLGCNNPAKSLEEYKEYTVQITNKSTSEIKNILFEMVGSDDKFEINEVAKSGTPHSQDFTLSTMHEPQKPISWGDISGRFSQNGLVTELVIFNYQYETYKVISIIIDSESYEVSFSGNQ